MAYDRSVFPRVSIVMPAYNAAAFIDEALTSIAAQSFTAWEIIIVDDGSSDDTADIAERWAQQDKRIRVLKQANAGASAARNTGLEAARAAWIAFIDSDDWVHRDYLVKLMKPLKKKPLNAVFCIAVDVVSDGSRGKRWIPPPKDNLFPVFATDCPIAVHSGIFRRSVLQEIGGWDPDLGTCEDWDLWMRLARTTNRIENVMEELAFIRLRTGSLSRSMPMRLARDGVIVIERAGEPDPRVPEPIPRWANGLKSPDKDDRVAQHLIWSAALDIAGGGDGKGVLGFDPTHLTAPIEPFDLAATVWDAISHTTGEMADDWVSLMPDVKALVAWIEERNPTPDLALRTFRALELMIFQYAYLKEPVAFCSTYWLTIDIEEPIETVHVPAGLSQLAVVAFDGEERIGTIGLDVRDGAVAAHRLADALARRFGGRLVYGRLKKRDRAALSLIPHLLRAGLTRKVARFGAAFIQMDRHSQYDRAKALAIGLGPDIVRASGIIEIAKGEAEDATAAAPLSGEAQAEGKDQDDVFMPHDEEYGTPYWEDVFANQDPWDYSNRYEQTKYEQTLALLPQRKFGRALELACAEGHFTQQLAPLVEQLIATDISATALERAKEACASFDNITYQQLDLKNGQIPEKFDLIVCSEVLYYFESRKVLAKIARKLAKSLAPGGMILMAHGKIAVNAPKETGFDWGHPFDSRSIREIFAKDPGLIIVEEAWSDIYGIQLFEASSGGMARSAPRVTKITRDPDLTYCVSSQIEWNGAAHFKKVEVSDKLPILNFHRVTPEPFPPALAPYCHTPEQFDAQLRYFAERGYYGVTLDAWQTERARWRGMPGRALAITFDDGFVDFLEHALPTLEKYGFPATMFLVSEFVGKAAQWDARHGTPAPLMTWEQIKEAANHGVQFGSHTASHPILSALSPGEVTDEANRSRKEIEQRLGQRVESIAYPYGDYNEIVARIFEDQGYTMGLNTSGDPAEIHDRPMEMSRIELLPTDGPEEIALKIPTPRKTNQLRALRMGLQDTIFRTRYNLF
ncbi:putative glycosyltransferase EpsJ (plasmid) [Sulfitobacter indolifex]|uniref:trifunctional glycosyltransferase/class I SAM-dependent methyltransferase/polysaccharide deacetylase n=1 Tax=Sulfitobacter indolifex TaxID=225422 RepID=UPI001FADE5A5|nr:trifunctional glycosyltransferase/class I SAM-dependent methyltransferase/polysaccharide deacetylase [Sulfitobacter indolifex]UOA21213.1 putative glycosyltransferase EpsJ [Sulfitobacter indolifex]